MLLSEKTLNDRPHPDPLPRGEGTATVRFALCRKSSGKSSRRLFYETANDFPSLGGEGRGEGERSH
jgi:hypothetical protein